MSERNDSDSDLLAALIPIAQSAHFVLNEDGTWSGRERIKDWFDYNDLKRVLAVARAHGWDPTEVGA